jgi:hypothetical protein
MKHIQLFEGWEQSEMDFETVPEISPEQFGQEVDHAVDNMSPADAARHVNKIASVLDQFAAGEISREEAIARLA